MSYSWRLGDYLFAEEVRYEAFTKDFLVAGSGVAEHHGNAPILSGEMCVAVLKLISFLAFLLGVIVAAASDHVAGGLILAGAFLISPFG